MPIDLTALGVLPSLAILFVFGGRTMPQILPGQSLPLVVDAVIFAAFSAFAIQHFGLLSLPSAEVAAESATAP
jgi:hypothetical protein